MALVTVLGQDFVHYSCFALHVGEIDHDEMLGSSLLGKRVLITSPLTIAAKLTSLLLAKGAMHRTLLQLQLVLADTWGACVQRSGTVAYNIHVVQYAFAIT